MRSFTLILALLFSCLITEALTIDNLLKRYRNLPDIQYEVIKGKELKALIDSVSSETEKDALRFARKLVIMGSIMDDKQHESLSSNLDKLDDYSLALSYSIDTPQKPIPLLGRASGSETSVNVNIFSKKSSSDEYLNQPVFLINMWGMVALAYLDGRIKSDTAMDLIQVTFSTSDSQSVAAKKYSAIDRIDLQRSIYPQEKIHVVTDRDLYCGGDTIWLRAFVVDADTHVQTAISKYAYVELLSPFGYADKRVKLMERDGVYSGYIPVDEDIYEGDYTLAAYTAFAENQGPDYFFRKPLKILAPQSSKYVIDSEFTPSGEDKVTGTFKIESLAGDPINYKVMSWIMPDGDFLELPHAKKGISRKFSRDKDENVVLVKFGDYGRYFNVEYPVEKTDLALYPEGGWLIADQPCTVAFKATDENGKGVAVSGVIRDDMNEEIATFSTVHNGMGSVMFIPEEGRTYTAHYMGPEAQLRTAEIGAAKSGAVSLRYGSAGNKGTFSVAGDDGQELELVVSLRGTGVIAAPISSANPLSFDKADMPTGLYQALLVSKTDHVVLSERLFFIGADRPLPAVSSLNPDSTSIRLEMPAGLSGDCSVRVTNRRMDPESPEIDIQTQLLLQSELRGRIENPRYYFNSTDRERERNLDLLMMVNGWSRYNIPDAIRGKYEEPKIPLEIGQEISGQVRSRWKNSPMEGVMVSAIVPKKNFGTFADTDSDGIFHLNGFDFPEGTPFILKAMNEKGGLEANYDIFEDRFPATESLPPSYSSVSTEDITDFFKGSRWILLDEVKVQAFRESNDDIYANFASYSRTADDMKVRGITSIEQALRGIGGITNHMGHLKWRYFEVSYYVDGQLFDPRGNATLMYNVAGQYSPWVHNALGHDIGGSSFYGPTLSEVSAAVPFNMIERIDFIRPEHSLVLGPSYGGPTVVITTKKGDKVHWERQFELKDHLPLGYQEYKEYASPMLSVDTDEYDLQTHPTLLWLPSVKFDDTGKTIQLKHPVKSDYSVIIEGISDNGDIISEIL